ncbi:MAG: tetratricopeptide repeat protein [Candidatus Poribacteria bacterium]|nr:tetratricopeptide repeat protein [Candidatus Poribacteria bacterium]
MKPIFLSYVRENEEIVDKFCQELISRGLKVWLDRQDLNPGSRWKQEIRKAIREGAFFVACFSKEQNKSDKTYMNEELTIAIDELRQKPSERIWFIPVKLNRCKIPDRNIGGGETLRDLHYINLYKDWDVGIQSILKVVQPEPSGPTKHENTSGNRVDSNTATDFSEGCIDQDSTNAENTFDTEKRDNNAKKVTENSLKGFITYSHEDTAAKEELRKRLAVMEEKNELTTWHDGEITAGDEWYEDISKNLAEADILLYLVSAASLASKNCNKELAEALTADIKVIPIILEHCDWQQHKLSDFEVLPLKGKPISQWEDPSEGWQNVVDGIRAAINKMQVQAKPSVHITPEEMETLSNVKLQQGNFLMMVKQMDQAIAAYSRAIELNPKLAEVYNNRGIVYAEKGELDCAIDDYEKAIELDPKFAEAYSNRGATYSEKSEFDRAIADCNKAIELNPKLANAYNGRSTAYRAKGEFDRAIADCNKAIELNPKLANAYNGRSTAYRAKGEFDRAIADCNKAIELNPKLANAYCGRSAAYGAKGEFDRAIADCNKAIELNPKLADAYSNRGNVHHKRGKIDKAIDDYNKAIELNPKLVQAYYNRGATYGAKGEFDRAIDDWNKVIELNPKLVQAYYNRGATYGAKGELDRAIADCNKAIELNPKLADAYYKRGIAHLGKGELDRALADYSKAIELDPGLAKAYNDLGAVYAKKGELHSAIVNFTKAIEFDPDYTEAYINRGITWLYLQEWEDFRSNLSTARNVGIDIAIGFRNACGSVANFERITGIQLPADIAAMLTPSS